MLRFMRYVHRSPYLISPPPVKSGGTIGLHSASQSVRLSVTLVFRTFLLHALTKWAEILHMTFFYYTTDQVRVSLICVNFFFGIMPLSDLEYRKYTVFRIFLLHPFTYWAEILHMTFAYCTTDQVWVSLFCVNFSRSYAPFRTWNIRNTQFSAFFSNILWHIQLKFCTWLSFTVLQIKFECHLFALIFVGVMPFSDLEYRKYAVFRTLLLHPFTQVHWNNACRFNWLGSVGDLYCFSNTLSMLVHCNFLICICLCLVRRDFFYISIYLANSILVFGHFCKRSKILRSHGTKLFVHENGISLQKREVRMC